MPKRSSAKTQVDYPAADPCLVLSQMHESSRFSCQRKAERRPSRRDGEQDGGDTALAPPASGPALSGPYRTR